MNETTSTASQPATQTSPFDRTILLSLNVSVLGVRRKVSTDAVEVQADKNLLSVSKKLLECDEFNAVNTVVRELKAYLRKRSIPGVSFVKGGIYPVPAIAIEDIDQRVQAFILLFAGRVARFCEVYEARASECRDRLGVLGDLTEYPPAEKVKQSFGITYEYITLGPPSKLAKISPELFQREKAKLAATLQGAADQAQQAMRQLFSEIINHITERLTPGPDGKKKKFNATMVGNFKEFLATFKDRNITEDATLEALVTQAQNILAGKDVKELRKDDATRDSVQKGMTAIKTALDGMLTSQVSRQITLDD